MAAPGSSVIDMPACFAARLVDLKIHHLLEAFQRRRLDTFPRLAFSTTYAPGQSAPAMFTEEVVIPLMAVAAPPELLEIRRIFYDAYTLVVADIKERTEGGGS